MTAPQNPIPPAGTQYPVIEAPKNGFGVASLILGIIGLFGSFFVIGALPALIGLVLGIIGYRRTKSGEANNSGVAIAGIITSVLALMIAIAIGALFAAVFSSEEFQDLTECIENANNDPESLTECRLTFGEDE